MNIDQIETIFNAQAKVGGIDCVQEILYFAINGDMQEAKRRFAIHKKTLHTFKELITLLQDYLGE